MLDAAGIAYTLRRGRGPGPGTGYQIQPVPGLPAFLGGSTWQSLTRGTGNVETDYLNGEIVRIARLARPRGADQRDHRVAGPPGRRRGDPSRRDLTAE